MSIYRVSDTRVCCICGKIFTPAVMHSYKKTWKRKTYFACKPSCYEKMIAAIEEEKDAAKRGKAVNKSIDKNGPGVL